VQSRRCRSACLFLVTRQGSYHPMLDEIPRLRSLVSFSRSETCAGPAGLVGQHTRQVLLEHGYDEQRIEALVLERAIVAH